MVFDIDCGVSNYLKNLKNCKPLSKENEREFILDYKLNNNLESRNIVIQSNLKYACSIANSYRGKGVEFGELIAEANDGLMEAIEKYDIKQNIKFITYAKWWIIQRITSRIANKNKHNGYDLPTDNILKESDDDLFFANQNVNDDYNKLFYDDIDYEKNVNEIKNFIQMLFKNLNDREKDIVKRYFGLNGKSENLNEISNTYGISSERIRQILDNSLKKLRSYALCY